MAGKKAAGENSKKAAGQARKADAAAAKQATKDKERSAAEDKKWQDGAKSSSKADAAAAKAAEAARKKEEKARLLREEEASTPSKGGKTGGKTAQKKTRGLDLSGLDGPSSKQTLNASGIDNALDALSLTSNTNDKIDRHPERRFKAAYAQYEEQRLEEMKDEKGLRRQQKIDQIRKEFEKHPDNPFNQVSAQFNTTREEMDQIRAGERAKTEARLASRS
jgi:hypothetical protein